MNKDELQKLIADEVRKQLLDVKAKLDDIVNMKQPKPDEAQLIQVDPILQMPDFARKVWVADVESGAERERLFDPKLGAKEKAEWEKLFQDGLVFAYTIRGRIAAGTKAERIRVEQQQPKPEQIEPAQPLREMPEDRPLRVWKAYQNGDVSLSYIGGKSLTHQETQWRLLIESGRLFPGNESGELGARIRAKQGIVPYPIQPAKALTEEPEVGEEFWFAAVWGDVVNCVWQLGYEVLDILSQGRCFPYTKAGKIGAAMFEEGGQDE